MPWFVVTKKVTIEYETIIQADNIAAAQRKVFIDDTDAVKWREFKPSETWIAEELMNWDEFPEIGDWGG